MLVGVLWALLAGLMLGLYALPEKFTKDFKFENTWGLFFMLTMFVVPIIATFTLMKGVGDVYAQIPVQTLMIMVVSSFLWGCGVMMWGKAINHIGLSLGFSLFIGTVILVGSILPIVIDVQEKGTAKGLPPTAALAAILVGIVIVLLGVISNGRAGLIREADEANNKTEQDESEQEQKGSMALGIFIAVFGGLLATGFNVAYKVGGGPLGKAVEATGNDAWVTAVAVMFPVFLSGGVVMAAFFGWQLSSKKAWGSFKTPRLPVNFVLILIMAVFHYAASASYAYAAALLGDLGSTVGYAIFNTTCVLVAIVSGVITGEWAKASDKAKKALFTGMACMVLGILIVACGNALNTPAEADDQPETSIEQQQEQIDEN